MHFDIQGSTVRTGTGATRDFGRRIRRAVDLGPILVVLLDPDDGPGTSENVYALDASARLVWRVQARQFPNGRTPYSQISRTDEGAIEAWNPCGVMVVLNPRDGRIIHSYLSK